jgi:hypothetical protein
MRIVCVGCAVMVAFSVASLEAQRSDQSVSVEAVRQALQKPPRHSLVIPPVFSLVPQGNRRLGILTLAAPDTNGEIVKVVVPIGELTTRLARKISSARRQRGERKAREAVERDLRDFQVQQAAK